MLEINPEFRRILSNRLGEEVLNLCYQCGKCSAHCPVFHQAPDKFNPRKIIEMAYLGVESILKKPDIWLCTTCYECVENCPQEINFVDLVILLRNIAMEKGLAPKPVVDEFNTVIKQGFLYPQTGRTRKIKESLQLPVSGNGASISLKNLLEVKNE